MTKKSVNRLIIRTGRTMISGCFPAASDTEAAFRIISRAWFKFSPLFEPILPSWINASVKDLKEFAMVVNSTCGWRQQSGRGG